MKLNKTYLTLTIILLTTEILIVVYLKTGFIRHTVGDYLCVILLYCFFKSFISGYHLKIAVSVLIFAFFIEFLQLFKIIEILNIQNQIIKIILGSTFHISDLVAYTLGIFTVLLVEYKIYKPWKT